MRVEDYPVRLIMLDSVVPQAGHGLLCTDRLAFLDETLSAQPHKPTMLVLHHPPMLTGDRLGWTASSSATRPNSGRFWSVTRKWSAFSPGITTGRSSGGWVSAIVIVAPALVHQTELNLLGGRPDQMVLEPPAYQLHLHLPEGGGIATHTAYVERFQGPYPFLVDADYPGYPARNRRRGCHGLRAG